MATLMSWVSGNFTAAGTWELCDSTAELDSEANSTAISTSNLDSQTFTPGAITVDGVAVKLSARAASPVGTFTVTLRNSTLSVDVASVTVNVSDLDSAGNGWYFFKFASSQLLLAGNAYLIRVVCSNSGSQVTLFRNATSNNWSRQLRTTTTQAPAAGDKLLVCGELTGAGAGSNFTVTMDNTATTTFGAIAFPQSVSINKRGTLDYGTSASTNYYLRVKGLVNVFGGGTLNIGTTGTPVPSTSTAILEFDGTANVDSGLILSNGFTCNIQGASKTVKAFLAADASAAATSLTTDVSTGWVSGDLIALASTTTTPSQSESKALTANASGTTLTITALTAAHSGTTPTRAELGNLTRNIVVRGISSSLNGYITVANTGVLDWDYAEFTNLGSVTTNKRGIDLNTTTGNSNIQFCSFHDFTSSSAMCFNITNAAANNITISNNVFFNINRDHITISATTGTSITIDNNLLIRNSTGNILTLSDNGVTLTNNTAVSATNIGLAIFQAAPITGTVSGNTAHACGGNGMQLSSPTGGTVESTTLWRNDGGLSVQSITGKIFFDGLVVFGNSGYNIDVGNDSQTTTPITLLELRFNELISDAGVTLTAPIGMIISSHIDNLVIDNSTFGATTTHATGDISIRTSGTVVRAKLRNCLLASGTEIANLSNLAAGSAIGSEKHDQTSGSHKAFVTRGTISIDTSIFDVTPSMRLTPNNAVEKLETRRFRAAVASGGTLTLSAKVRESVVGDGTDYNGNRVRLILVANPALGVDSDTVLDTASVASEGAFETLSGVTPTASDDGVFEFYLDCDGTTGWVSIDTIAVS